MIDKQLLEDAKAGNVEAQASLAALYNKYDGINENQRKAFFWYYTAAMRGHAESQCMLGSMYYRGNGTSIDYKRAIHWYTKAAEQGDAQAQFTLGCCYHYLEEFDHDFEEAFVWYSIAANQGHAEAQCNLGLMYLDEPNGLPESMKNTAYWIGLAYINGSKEAEGYWKGFELWRHYEYDVLGLIFRKIS
tara:strand:+ start:319 stop:885 length:567 start_codon:yes stop_codon:yes gene_type:complete